MANMIPTAMLLFLIGFTQLSRAAEIPVVINLPADKLADLSHDDQATLELVKEMLERNIWKWDELQFELPETVFSDNEVIVRDGDLFKRPSSSEELFELATGPGGKAIKLDPSQIESVRDTGLLVIPSKKYPGQNHVWKFALWIQKGRKNIEVTLDQYKASSLETLIVKVPNLWKKGTVISVRDGLTNISKGLRGSLSLLVGLIEKTPKYSDGKVEQIIEELAAKYALTEAQQNPANYDLRLLDEDLMKKAVPLTKDIVMSIDNDWPAIQRDAIPVMIEKMDPNTPIQERQKTLSSWLEQLRIETFYSRLSQDGPLNQLSAGLGDLFIRQDKANRFALQSEADFARDYDAKKAALKADLLTIHPLRGKIAAWTDPRVKVELDKYVEEQRPLRHAQLIAKLEAEGLVQEAAMLKSSLKYYSGEGAALKKTMSQEMMASRVMTLQNRIFFAKNWIKSKDTSSDGNVRYFATKYETVNVSTATPLWRLKLGALRAWSLWKNVNYWNIVQNLINGPVGVKSLVLPNDFTPFRKMNELTGEVVTDESIVIGTLLSRQKKIGEWATARREAFEKAPDTGSLGKDVVRPFFVIENTAKAVVASAVVWAGQPTLTLANILLFGGLGVLPSPVLAPLAGVAWWASDFTFFDTARPTPNDPRILPLARGRLVNNVAVGVGQVATSLGGTMLLPFGAAYEYADGQTIAKTRSLWDFIMAKVFLSRARVPATDSYSSRRIQGPGLAADFSYQVQPALAVVALQAKLEAMELSMYSAAQQALIDAPKKSAAAFINASFGLLGLGQADSDWSKEISAQSEALTKKLHEMIDPRFEKLPGLGPKNLGPTIRMTEADLNATLASGVPVVRNFWEQRVLKWLTPKQNDDIWNKMSLAKNDFNGLTRSLLEQVFGDGFTTPLESVDQKFVIHVTTPNFGGIVDSITSGHPLNPGEVLDENTKLPARAASRLADPTLGSARELLKTILPTPCEVVLKGVDGHRYPL